MRLSGLLLWVALLVACAPSPQLIALEPGDVPPPISTRAPTAIPTSGVTPTAAPAAAPTATPTVRATATPTRTPSPTPSPTATPTALPTDSADRSCPTQYFPAYTRYATGPQRWPQPLAQWQPHFWLGKPLPPGVGRLLTTQFYPYGYDGGRDSGLLLHNAVDVAEQLGTPVLAAADGVVLFARPDLTERHGWRCDWYGEFVTILHDAAWRGQPVYTLYGHVLNITVREGQRVRRGEQIAEVGFGGAASAPHLHFEVRVGANDFFATRNPLLWLRPGEGRGVLAGRLLDPQGRPWQGVAVRLLPQDADADAPEYYTWSYLGDPDGIAQPDDELAENFVFGDIKAGRYTLYTEIEGAIYTQTVTIDAGQIATATITTARPQATPTGD